MKPFIKLFTGIGALILMVLGFAILALTVYGFINSSIFAGYQSKNTILGIMLAISIAIIGGSIEGIYGICKQKPKMICGFQILVILFMLIFLGLGIGLILLPGVMFQGDCRTSTNVVIQYMDTIYTKSETTFCVPNECTCGLNEDNATLSKNYNDAQIAIIHDKFNNSGPAGFNTTEGCLTDLSDPEKALFTTIGQFQKLLSCSLWCPDSPYNLFYRFQNVNNGKPQGFCYTKLKDAIDQYSYYGKLGSFSASGVLLLMFTCNMYICCNPKRKNKRMRDRFMYMSDQDDYEYDYRRDDDRRDRRERRNRR